MAHFSVVILFATNDDLVFMDPFAILTAGTPPTNYEPNRIAALEAELKRACNAYVVLSVGEQKAGGCDTTAPTNNHRHKCDFSPSSIACIHTESELGIYKK